MVYCALHRFEQNRNLIKIFYKIFRFYSLHYILKSCKITEINNCFMNPVSNCKCIQTETGHTSGSLTRPGTHAGIRFIVSQKFSQSMTFGLFYKVGIEQEKYKTIGFNFLVDL